MMVLNLRNSGDAVKRSADNGGGCVSPGFAASVRLEDIFHLPILASRLFVRQSPANDVTHHEHKSLNVRHIPVIVAESLLVNVAEQVERFDRNVRTLDGSLQKASILLPNQAVIAVRPKFCQFCGAGNLACSRLFRRLFWTCASLRSP
jgi:hypothetical protein